MDINVLEIPFAIAAIVANIKIYLRNTYFQLMIFCFKRIFVDFIVVFLFNRYMNLIVNMIWGRSTSHLKLYFSSYKTFSRSFDDILTIDYLKAIPCLRSNHEIIRLLRRFCRFVTGEISSKKKIIIMYIFGQKFFIGEGYMNNKLLLQLFFS